MSALSALPLQAGGLDLSGGLMAFALLVFAAYVAVLIYLGYDGYKSTDGLRDFILGGKSLNGLVVGLSFGATYASANMFMGVPGMAYVHGTPALWWSTIGFGMPFIGIVLFAKRFWLMSKLGVGDMTLPEWIAKRYDSPYLRAGAGILSMFLVFYIVGQGVGAATMFEQLFNTPYVAGLAVALALVAFYVTIGGMQTTIMTDFFQSILMMTFAGITFASIFIYIDGGLTGVVSGLSDQGAATTFNSGTSNFIFDHPLGVAIMTWFLVAFILMPHLMNRVLVLDDRKELKRFAFGAGISLFTMSVFMIWAGLAGRVLFPDLSNPDAVVPMYLMEALPPILAVFIIVGILSAILTTADSLLHAMVTIVQQDLYKHTWLKQIRGMDIDTGGSDAGEVDDKYDKRATRIGQIAAVVIAGAAFVIGLDRPDSLFMLTQIGIAGFLSGTTIPVILGYFWKGSTKRGAEVGFTIGMATYIIVFFGIGYTGYVENQFMAFTMASITSLIGMAGVSLFTEDSVEEQQAIAFGRTTRADGGEITESD
jgi:Na+/proline symporter